MVLVDRAAECGGHDMGPGTTVLTGARDGAAAKAAGAEGSMGPRWRGGGRGGRLGMGMGMRGRGGPGEFGLAGLLNNPEVRQQIGVSADQAAKIRQQESDFRKTEIRNRADLQVKRLDLRDLLSADKPDRAAIDSKLQDISTSQLAMEKAAVGHQLDMREALSPAQREKLRQWMMQRRDDAAVRAAKVEASEVPAAVTAQAVRAATRERERRRRLRRASRIRHPGSRELNRGAIGPAPHPHVFGFCVWFVLRQRYTRRPLPD